MIHAIQILAAVLGGTAALLSISFFIQVHWPAPLMWFLKLYVSAISPIIALMGVLIIGAGMTTRSTLVSLIGIYVTVVFFTHIYKVTRPPQFSASFEKAFGNDWEKFITDEQKNHFLPARSIIALPKVSDPRFEQNISFVTIPGTDRQLLCDVWQPPVDVVPSGLAVIYFHGSAFYFLDKDLNTRPLFRHLAAQGHVIMDVAYRLAPETDVMGMVYDVRRAVNWMKENAGVYKVNPDRIVLGGGSAGGHLAMLAAYTLDDPRFTPEDLKEKDNEVGAVVSLYGTSDFEAVYYHTNQHLTTRSTPDRPKKSVPTKMPKWIIKQMGTEYHRLGLDKGFENAGSLPPLLGGHPDEIPETYALLSPITHVHANCPPTLLIHGEHDIMAPVKSTHLLHKRLIEEGVITVANYLPQTNHAFDLILTKISPSAHNEIYDLERFLAVMVKKQTVENKTATNRDVSVDHSEATVSQY